MGEEKMIQIRLSEFIFQGIQTDKIIEKLVFNDTLKIFIYTKIDIYT